MPITPEGFLAVKFDAQLPNTPAEVAANIRHALSLGLPEADAAPIKTLNIVANGPSAALYDIESDGETLAVNGSLGLFTAMGKSPTYWAACDSQAVVADFLTDPPRDTKYLIASRCHPSVFEALRGRDVRVWHVAEDDIETPPTRIARACTVTLCSLTLMHRLGYRHFEIYGWDGCYDGLTHHASDAPLAALPDNARQISFGRLVDGELVADKSFWTMDRWAVEAQEAVVHLQFADYTYRIHGPGMIAETIRAHVNRNAVDGVGA